MPRMRSSSAVAIAMAVLVAALFAPASQPRAEIVTVGLTAVVFYVEQQTCWCLDNINEGDTLVAYYTHSTDPVDTNPDPHVGDYVYSSGPTRIVVYLNDYVFRSDPANVNVTFKVSDGVIFGGSGPEDRYNFSSWNNKPTIPGYATERIQIHLGDDTAQVLADDALPTSTPDLNAWGYFASIGLWGSEWAVGARIVSIQSSPPSAIAPRPFKSPLDLRSFPNPFAGITTISWRAPEHGTVTLNVYDVSGKLVREISPARPSGRSGSASWDGNDSSGRRLASGVYFVRASTPFATDTRKLVLMR